MQHFLFKNRSRLSGLIDDIWKWECVEADLRIAKLTRLESISAAARQACVCQ